MVVIDETKEKTHKTVYITRYNKLFGGASKNKKFKKCCISKNDGFKNNEFKASYRFESGSYGDVGVFMPSIACLKQLKRAI